MTDHPKDAFWNIKPLPGKDGKTAEPAKTGNKVDAELARMFATITPADVTREAARLPKTPGKGGLGRLFMNAAIPVMAGVGILYMVDEAKDYLRQKDSQSYDTLYARDNLSAIFSGVKGGTVPCKETKIKISNMTEAMWKSSLNSGDAGLQWAYTYKPDRVIAYYSDLAQKKSHFCGPGRLSLCPPALVQNALDLHAAYTPSHSYFMWDHAGRSRLIKAINADAVLKDARKRWHIPQSERNALDLNGRVAAVEHYLALHTAAFSDGDFQPRAPSLLLDPDMDKTAGANYAPATHTVGLRPSDMMDSTFGSMFENVEHEARHSTQRSLGRYAQSYAGIAYVKAKGLELEATIFQTQMPMRMNDNGVYFRIDDSLDAYKTNPVEREARRGGIDGRLAGKDLPAGDIDVLLQSMLAEQPDEASKRDLVSARFWREYNGPVQKMCRPG